MIPRDGVWSVQEPSCPEVVVARIEAHADEDSARRRVRVAGLVGLFLFPGVASEVHGTWPFKVAPGVDHTGEAVGSLGGPAAAEGLQRVTQKMTFPRCPPLSLLLDAEAAGKFSRKKQWRQALLSTHADKSKTKKQNKIALARPFKHGCGQSRFCPCPSVREPTIRCCYYTRSHVDSPSLPLSPRNHNFSKQECSRRTERIA